MLSNSEMLISNTEEYEVKVLDIVSGKVKKKFTRKFERVPNKAVVGGYKVLEISASKSFDGLSAEVNGIKVIVINGSLFEGNNTRKRFTALHELAHHSFIISDNMDHKEAEKLCHVFASAVLYPEEMARKELHNNRFHFFENELILLKERWGISISAIFYCALRLRIITNSVFRNLNISYRSRGYHRDEPGKYLSQEKPVRFLRLVYFALGKELITINEAAYYTGESIWEFRKTMYQLA